MNDSTKAAIIIIVFGLVAFLTGNLIWPPAEELMPTPEQLPFLILLSAVEALVFGAGIAFLVLGWPYLEKAKASKWVFLSIAWSMVSWWPHDHLHAMNGMNLDGLIAIEYGFHATLMIAAVIIAKWFFRQIKNA